MKVQDHRSLIKEDWSFKDEAIQYLERDLLSLYQVLFNANQHFYLNFGIQITEHLTI